MIELSVYSLVLDFSCTVKGCRLRLYRFGVRYMSRSVYLGTTRTNGKDHRIRRIVRLLGLHPLEWALVRAVRVLVSVMDDGRCLQG